MRIVRVALLSALLLFSMLPLLDLPLLLRVCRIAPVGHDWHDAPSVRGSGQGGTDSTRSAVRMGSVRPFLFGRCAHCLWFARFSFFACFVHFPGCP